MKSFNVGVIGFGWAATAHIQAINHSGHAQVTALYSSRPQNDAELSAKYGSPIKSYTKLEEFLAHPGLEVVDITSYPWEHAKHAIAAAEAGKHIILEKPIALSWKDCLAIEKAANTAKVKGCVCFEVRYCGQFLATKSIIDQGLLGEIHYGEVDYFHGIGPWYGQYRWNTTKRGGGSSLLSAGCHAMDMLLLCMNGEVETVTSLNTGSKNPVFTAYEYPTTTVTLLHFKDGRVGKCASVIDCIQPYYFHTHLVGSEGSMLDNKIHTNKIASLNKKAWSQLNVSLADSGDVADHPYQTQFEAFFAALTQGKDMPLTSLKDALKTHQVIFAADKSASQGGKPIKLSSIRW
ncbi:MAG TPA: Gfo/Idh/MocA family oxidoreductase [Candidatus Limnocylindria bacterium]|jgi:predicted dehydrogenase|nr:Gfo/Idh/MocA family oxidoreductase [Candidatus Limnocylindria bacterium]